MSWRPGIDVAVHTEAQLLSAAAYAEFRQACRTAWTGGTAFKRSFCGRALWCSSTTLPRHGCLAGPQNFRPYVSRHAPSQGAPVAWVFGEVLSSLGLGHGPAGVRSWSRAALRPKLGSGMVPSVALGPFGAPVSGIWRSYEKARADDGEV